MAIRGAGRNLSDFFGDKPDYAALGNQAVQDAAKGEINTALNNARTAATTMSAIAADQAANHWADATREIGAMHGQTSAVLDTASAVGGLGGLFPKRGGVGPKSYGSLGVHDVGGSVFNSARDEANAFSWS